MMFKDIMKKYKNLKESFQIIMILLTVKDMYFNFLDGILDLFYLFILLKCFLRMVSSSKLNKIKISLKLRKQH